MEKRTLENAMQICNILEFINEYCEIYNTATFILNIGVCASNLMEWDLEIEINKDYEEITFKFWSPSAYLEPVKAYLDIDKVSKQYDINKLDSYTICNKGLD